MKRKILFIILIIIFAICMAWLKYRICAKNCKIENSVENINQTSKKEENSENIDVVATRNDEIASDTTWCGTFQLVWNDMINEVVKQDVILEEQLPIVENLNQQDFSEDLISSEYYYKKFGLKTLDLKNEIENGIKQKFNETSDILDDFDWSEDALNKGEPDLQRYFFYTMLKRDFTYKYEFDQLENGLFAGKYSNIKYFGINDSTEDKVRKQIDVLYYESPENCAVILNTVEGDQVILCRGMQGSTFREIYDNMMQKSEEYQESSRFKDIDYLTIPEIDFNIKREYKELENKRFETADKNSAKIEKAIQSIKMKMDKKGGSIKSEAAIDMMVESAMPIEEEKPRYFEFTDEFTIFLSEAEKEEPYFAAHISDITKFQL